MTTCADWLASYALAVLVWAIHRAVMRKDGR